MDPLQHPPTVSCHPSGLGGRAQSGGGGRPPSGPSDRNGGFARSRTTTPGPYSRAVAGATASGDRLRSGAANRARTGEASRATAVDGSEPGAAPGPPAGPRAGLARALKAVMTDEAGEYAGVLTADIAALVEHNLAVLDRIWPRRRVYTEADLDLVRAVAARVAAADVPLEVLLRAVNRAVETLFCRLVSQAARHRPGQFVALTRHGMRLARQVTGAAAEAHHRARELRRIGDTPGDPLTLRALLAGDPPPPRAAGQPALVDRYLVAVAGWPSGATGPDGPDGLAARLRAGLPPGPLYAFTPSGGTLLLPEPAPGGSGAPTPDRREARLVTAGDALAELRRAVGAAVRLAVAGPVGRNDLARAHREAERSLRLARGLGRPPGLHRLSDLAYEAQLDRPGEARAHMLALVAPLADHPALLTTLRTLLANDGNRHRTATGLRIHRSTLDHRLHRIESLTGLSPTGTAGVQRFGAALVLYDLDEADRDPRP